LLLVEDSERDAAQVMLSLRRGGWAPEMLRVETREEMTAALQRGTWDAIVADYHLPCFSAPDALATLRETGLDIPFIVVTGVIGEDTAVRLMRGGASDYLNKARLGRLNAALEREIGQAHERRAKRRAESLFHSVLRASPHPAAIVDRATKLIVDASDSLRDLTTKTPFHRGTSVTELIDFSLPERIDALIARGSGTALHTVYYAGGIGRVANIRAHPVEHDGGSYVYLVIEDVTEQNHLKAAFDAIPDSVLVIGADQHLLYANRAAEELLGELFFGMDVTPLLTRPGVESRWWLRRTSRFDEQRVVVNGQPYSAASVVFRFAGEPNASTILTLHNVAEEEALQHLATHDALTGAWNVRHLAGMFEALRANGGAFALLDLDHFKEINDERGHAAGDATLITFVNLVRHELRDPDLLVRVGGDEFTIVFPRLDLAAATTILTAIYKRLAAATIGVSCGVTPFDARDSLEAARARADTALYEAKRAGRGRWVAA
jgi:diguanylate cyclase (GGDEF)-like protein